jgi:hypothetical protein
MDAAAVVFVGCTVNANCVAVPGVILNPVLVADVSAPEVAFNVYPVPVLLILILGNVATPATAVCVAVPDSVPLPGFVPIARITALTADVTTLPSASSMLTCTFGVIDAAAAVFVGCTVNANCVAVPGVILKPLLVAAVSAPEVAFNV